MSIDAVEDFSLEVRALGRNAVAVAADVTDSQALTGMVAATIEGLGRIDVAVRRG